MSMSLVGLINKTIKKGGGRKEPYVAGQFTPENGVLQHAVIRVSDQSAVALTGVVGAGDDDESINYANRIASYLNHSELIRGLANHD